jgi:predicted DsbA family dithiol-disulfide isomerase
VPVGTVVSDALKVEIWSDVVCPWCYIGKRRFEAGASAAGVPIDVTWRSFQLDPSAPHEATDDVATHLGRKYGGGRANGLAMNARVTEVAAAEGLDYHLDQALYTNTTDAHRLLHLAHAEGGPGAQDALKERLLAAYFVQGRAVSDHDVLAELATEAGLPAERVRAVLSTDEFGADVVSDQQEAAALGAGGVPFFVIDRRYGVSGAQPAELFEQALRQAWAERRPALITPVGGVAPSADGDACGPDGC